MKMVATFVLVVLVAGCVSGGTPNGYADENAPAVDDPASVDVSTNGSGTEVREESSPVQTEQIFFSKDGVSMEHYWPSTYSLKGDESEMLIYNEGGERVSIVSVEMTFTAGGRTYEQYSGTWEAFPSRQSWERIDYVNMHPDYYKGEPLVLEPGQKGKVHYHYRFGDVSGEQSVSIDLTYKAGGTAVVKKKLTRTAPDSSGDDPEGH
ncbi:MAG: hypothetical protein HYS81_04820 [Candidatus Aenigmatarchaeota archaeon]|nr:MAG: hypothetical protein HYS81_04820 [Candidatus Aenigmarchaeota archaeon]